LRKGMRVGVGAQVDSCSNCRECKRHEEELCEKAVLTYNSHYPDGTVTYGGYSQYIRAPEEFTFAIPENLPSEGVAPLLCAGITTYAPLRVFNVGGQELGVLGVGGLGHLGIKWGKALGCNVTAISSKMGKERSTRELGADNFLCTTDLNSMKEHSRSLDCILSTVSANIDWKPVLNLLKPDGRFIMVGLPEEPLNIMSYLLTSSRISICGSTIGSPDMIREMLKLAGDKNITANTELWPLTRVNEALDGVRQGKPRYRYVLDVNH